MKASINSSISKVNQAGGRQLSTVEAGDGHLHAQQLADEVREG